MICTIDMSVEQVFTEVPSYVTARHCPWHKALPSGIQHYAHSMEEALSSIVVSDNLLTCCDPSCLSHQLELDLIGSAIVKCLHDCASNTMSNPCSERKVAG